ncbi:11449_t:CDS:2 [Diversispora eburnea]|uniref:Phosphatidylinositol 4-kinase n=1 Tax=Diversispora eburnea TaxID=1213867 RepID=A0A9N9G1W9_9GLOM|nr:11449_t:CDS:2 [Diversispora eburnea]
MFKSNYSQPGYSKLKQNSFEEDDYFSLDDTWQNHDNNVDFIIPIPRKQKRALSESREPYNKIPIPKSSMEITPFEITRDSDGIEYVNNQQSFSAWSQLSKKLKFGKGKTEKDLDIFKSVFNLSSQELQDLLQDLQDWQSNSPLLTTNHGPPITNEIFIGILDSVKVAIDSGVQPTRIRQGSSGSYFCRNKDGKIVGVFKPKNEEPYGRLNPKWTKWIHRNLFPCFFGRSCLIPNLGYISEAAASLLDRRLNLNIVPVTEVVWLSSPSFHYDYLDRRAARSKKNPKPLPVKIGSFQVFLDGYIDANVFLREHPWPERHENNESAGTSTANERSRLSPLICGRSGTIDDDETNGSHPLSRFCWTPALQLQFREQFEKLVILDYLMRNTDRGLDNWMIKYCETDGNSSITNSPPKSSVMKAPEVLSKDNSSKKDSKDSKSSKSSKPVISNSSIETPSTSSARNNSQEASKTKSPFTQYPHIHIAAIDNGLAFPFKHPDQWRSYPYGWAYLSDALIGQPFTTNTRKHFLKLLTDVKWWKETVYELGRFFSVDSDFDEGMFSKQIAVLKGQGWNIVETLKHPNQGPKDLIYRENAMVWDVYQFIVIPDEPTDRNQNNDGIDISNRNSITDDDSNRLSEDGPTLSTSAPAATSFPITSSKNKYTWSDRINRVKEKFNFDHAGKRNKQRTKKVLVEKVEIVKGRSPFFTWC